MTWVMPLIQGAARAYGTAAELKQQFRNQADRANAAAAYDKSVLVSAAQTIGRLNVERAAMYKQTTGALAYIRAKKKAAQASTAAINAASDTVGASADAALSDAEVQAGAARANVLYNLDVQDNQLSNRQSDVLTGASRSLVGGDLADVMDMGAAGRQVFQGFLAGFSGAGGGSSLGQGGTKEGSDYGKNTEGKEVSGMYGNRGDDSSQYGESTYGSNMSASGGGE